MRFKITFILICLKTLLFCCTAVPLKLNKNENERIPDPLSRSEEGLYDDFPEADEDSTRHYGLNRDDQKNNSLEDLITEIDEEVKQLFDETKLLYHSMEEGTNFLDIIAQKVAGLHPNSSVERYDRDCGGVLDPSESGVIRYKVNEIYDLFEDCTWIIEVPGAIRIEFILEKNGFGDCCDFVTITSVYDPPAVRPAGQKLRLRDKEPRGFVTGSRAIVRFFSVSLTTGKGFRLRFLKRLDFDTTIEPEGSKCGGVIVGATGYLNYKVGKDYLNNEACVWLLHSPGSQSIHLQLIDDEFDICCDYLSVNTIDPETGAMRNDTTIFNARNWTQTIEANLLIILFYSDDFDPGKGFSLQFNSRGNQLNVKYKYKLQHISGMFGTTEYPSEQAKREGSVRGEQDILVIASSRITIPDKYYTVIDWKAQQPNGSCLLHSLVIYEQLTEQSKYGISLPTIWLENKQFPKSKESDCPNANTMPTKYNEKIEGTFNVEQPAFIIVYKSLSNGRNGTETSFKFDYSRKLYTCGGVLEPLQSEYGLISYTEDDYFENLENCDWTIEVPKAAGIEFVLEHNVLETRDLLYIVSIDTVESIVELSYDGIQTIVTGSRARVTFTSDELSVGGGFRLRYKGVKAFPMDHVCGGIANTSGGDFGVIRYKEYWNYANNESCVWLIELLNASSIGFTLEESGFQKCCDYITVSGTDDGWNKSLTEEIFRLRTKGETAIVWGPKAIVRFSSDSSTGGQGFHLSFKKLPDWVTGGEDGKCGGVIREQSGVLNYKPVREYLKNEQCVWLLHSPNSASITLNLFWNGLEDCCAYLDVSTIDAKNGSIIKDSEYLRKNSTYTFKESILVIVFLSDSSVRGKGFSLVFSSNGFISDPEYKYNLCHLSDHSGKIEYPSSVWKSTGSGNKDIFIVTHSLNVWEEEDNSQLVMKLNWESGVLKKANSSCEYGEVSISIYSAQDSQEWKVIERFPNDNVTFSCSDVVTVAAKELSVTPISMFLVIYKPVEPNKNLLNDESTSFTLIYEMDICGGVYAGNSGVIKYKFDERYLDNEECVWLIEVPRAESIFFELEGEFEDDYDYITVSSIEPFTGVETRAIVIKRYEMLVDDILSDEIARQKYFGDRNKILTLNFNKNGFCSENPETSIKGQVAIVTFSSDDEVRGYGFRLHFYMKTQMSEEPAVVYQLFHQKLQTQNEFAYNAESNQVAIAAFSAGINLRKRIEVDITTFVPQVNESCYSDSLLIYDVTGRRNEAIVLTKAFTSANVDTGKNKTERNAFPQSCVSLTEIHLPTCKNNEQCRNVSTSRIIQTGSTFLAIYNSINVTDNLKYRGFALTSQIK